MYLLEVPGPAGSTPRCEEKSFVKAVSAQTLQAQLEAFNRVEEEKKMKAFEACTLVKRFQ